MTTALGLHGLGALVEVRCVGRAAPTLEAALRQAWSRCLVVDDDPHDRGLDREGPEVLEARLDDHEHLARELMTTTQSVTRALIRAQVGHLLMLHAGAVSDPVTGAGLVYVAPGGTGKTTLSRLLGRRFGYLTDETVGIDDTGAVLPYPKPLSLRRARPASVKDEVSPDVLGLVRPAAAPFVRRVVLLDRRPDAVGVDIEDVRFMDAVVALTEQSSSLPVLPRPLHRLADLIDSAGPVLRVTYAEAVDVEDDLVALLEGAA